MHSAHIDIIGLSETWLNSQIPDVGLKIDDFKIIRNDRLTIGDGVAFYIRNSIRAKVVNLPANNIGLEQLWISIKIAGKRVCLGTLCSPPSTNLIGSLNYLETALTGIIPEHDYVVFGGDLNIDLLNNRPHIVIKLKCLKIGF
ncbi:hypothetical protein JTB14_023556 [Gonioctena quinquepunctata]|nr:hypothetical protein JTB14_023556 [Gonioctena quinquepunctata]